MSPQKILNYTLLREIGQGGMATVYYAENNLGNLQVAVKILKPELRHLPEVKARFLQEARIMVGLNHPNIRQVIDLYDGEDGPAIILEYLQGADLHHWISDHGPASPGQAVDWVCQALAGLQFAHKKGIIHRDIKPSNLFLTQNGVVKIMDFGIARSGDEDLQLTKTHSRMGSPMYMSPEQIRTPK